MRHISWHILDSKRIDQNFNCLLNVFATYLFICIVVCNKKKPILYDYLSYTNGKLMVKMGTF